METQNTQPTHRTILTEVQGWIPLIDHLVDRYDLITAAVFGRMWRYSQMRSGVCRASLPTIANDLGLSRNTVRKAVARLCADGYMLDLTPGNSGRVHFYRDTGKVTIASRFSVETMDALDTPPGNGGVVETTPKTPPPTREAPPGNGGDPSTKYPEPLHVRATNHKRIEGKESNQNLPWWWKTVKDHLRVELPKSAYDTYVDPLTLASITDNLVILQSPSDHDAQWCASRLSTTIRRQLTGLLNRTVELVITSSEELP